MAEGWKLGGWIRGDGIPAPSGKYRVGCVDLMLDLVGDGCGGGLLMRLHYPTNAVTPATAANGGYPYAMWYPRREYFKGYLDFIQARFSGMLSYVSSKVVGMFS